MLALLVVGADALSATATTTSRAAIGDLLRRTPGVAPGCAYDATPLQSGFATTCSASTWSTARSPSSSSSSRTWRGRAARPRAAASSTSRRAPRVWARECSSRTALVQEFSPARSSRRRPCAPTARGSRRRPSRRGSRRCTRCRARAAARGAAALWVGVDAMLGDRGGAGGALDAGALAREARRMRAAVDGVARADVLGHGDFKPSNVLLHDGAAVFIDFELAGPNYRGYDIFKLFRTNEMAPASDAELLRFIAVYLAEGGADSGDAEAARCLAESKLFEPLTWLEAAIFFEFAAARLPEKRDEMRDLARDRWAA
ncbi:hypothetical protein JL720_4130 [Aureococcus anophagefferens]|nr:hypothetical protein JL720_4130 [Aureococcus anophagefferens]